VIQQTCRDLKLSVYAERWVQIRYYLLERKYWVGGYDLEDMEQYEDFDPVEKDDGERGFRDDCAAVRLPRGCADARTADWPHEWLPDELIQRITLLFAEVSEAFDRMFYIAGSCRTAKNDLFGYTTEEVMQGKAPKNARHNILHVRLQ
jgi:hypothetical protein